MAIITKQIAADLEFSVNVKINMYFSWSTSQPHSTILILHSFSQHITRVYYSILSTLVVSRDIKTEVLTQVEFTTYCGRYIDILIQYDNTMKERHLTQMWGFRRVT